MNAKSLKAAIGLMVSYGWVILLIMIALSVLLYQKSQPTPTFLNPEAFLSDDNISIAWSTISTPMEGIVFPENKSEWIFYCGDTPGDFRFKVVYDNKTREYTWPELCSKLMEAEQ